ncbi:MAG: HAD family hydrolase [Methanosarcinaceae archaeon]|nr:HAD family hydrolase [Methanosarcinaceae archaeon]MDD4498403.1 HAD family hydrolase [Methanosarcinaceae archaeon]
MDESFYGPLEAVVFDMDNTFFDFVGAKLEACRQILDYLKREGKPVSGNEEALFGYFVRGTHGFEAHENLRDFLQDNAVFTARHYDTCRTIYEKEKLENLELYPGVKTTFDELKKLDLKLAVLTDADGAHTSARLEKVGLEGYFDKVVSFDMTGHKKPDPIPFRFVLQELGVKAKAALFVGDSLRRDITPARELGLKTAYAAYGDRNCQEEKGQEGDFKLRAFPEVLDCIAALKSDFQKP